MPEQHENPTPGDIYLCKYAGRGNGDLIVGRVLSVASTSRYVTLADLFTGRQRGKQVEILFRRNWRTCESDATLVVEHYKTHGKAAARELAVELYRESYPARRKAAKQNGPATPAAPANSPGLAPQILE